MYPLHENACKVGRVNLKISTGELLRTCRAVLAARPQISGRALRRELLARLGSAGKKDRVYAVWRALRLEMQEPAPDVSTLEAQLQEARQQVASLQAALLDAEQRAARSEERERLHQDRWAMEIYRLREELRAARARPRG
jgi:hypothetical protein